MNNNKNEKTGVVTKAYGLYYAVKFEGREYNCFLKGKIRIDKQWKEFSNPVAVGDNVIFEMNDDSCIIKEVLPRKNIFSRKFKGRKTKQDIIAANLDNLVIIQSFIDPLMNLRFVDRLCVHSMREGITPILCLNKVDLATEEFLTYVEEYYAKTALEVFITSAENNIGIDELKNRIAGERSIFAGFSGVGKTSILQKILPETVMYVNEISESTGKGRHTTTNVMMFSEGDSDYIDSPGLREFGILNIEPHLLSQYFYEFSKYSKKCGFQCCTHDHEPGCEVKRLVEKGKIPEERYVSYINILLSIKEYYNNMYK